MEHNHMTAVIDENCPACRAQWPEYLPGEPLAGERETVECDENCGAYYEPLYSNPAEVIAAYEHWRGHSSYAGCAHGC